MTAFEKPYSIETLRSIMRALRTPETGCPWDIEQTFETIAPYTIEEAYEVDDAIRSGDRSMLVDELGDLLFQTIFYTQMGEEEGSFTFDTVIKAICDKMIRRHPHVFGTADITSADDQTAAWETQKAKERADKAEKTGKQPHILDDVPVGLPALLRAQKLQKRAARIGFDWPDIAQVFDKIAEETQELKEAIASGKTEHIAEEFGDLMFVMVNLGRHLGLDVEETTRRANTKFKSRFDRIEAHFMAAGVTDMTSLSLDDMEDAWQIVKKREKS